MLNESLEKLYLSHVLYRVKDLHTAVEKLEKAGFKVEYGTKKEKAYNAMIWFEDGVFIEIYENSGLNYFIKLMMKIIGYQSVLDRMKKWDNVENGWCEWSLESKKDDLDYYKKLFHELKIPFKFHRAKRIDLYNQKLTWQLLMPTNIHFPFMMSAYSPSLKPVIIQHPNGVKSIKKLYVGKKNLDLNTLEDLIIDFDQLEFIDKKTGLQTVEFYDSDLTIESILNN